MAKLSKKALAEFDAALDQLGGGAAPVIPPVKPGRSAVRARKKATKPAAKRKVAATRKSSATRKTGTRKR